MSLLVSVIFVFWFDIPIYAKAKESFQAADVFCNLKTSPLHFRNIVVALQIEKFYLRE